MKINGNSIRKFSFNGNDINFYLWTSYFELDVLWICSLSVDLKTVNLLFPKRMVKNYFEFKDSKLRGCQLGLQIWVYLSHLFHNYGIYQRNRPTMLDLGNRLRHGWIDGGRGSGCGNKCFANNRNIRVFRRFLHNFISSSSKNSVSISMNTKNH